jgi:trigger factor
VKIKVYPTSGCTRELRVEVEPEVVQVEVDGLYSKFSKEAALPGFRKGKAPLDLIKHKFKGHVKEEILRETLPKYFREAVANEKIEPIAQPRITEYTFEEGTPLRFVAIVEVKPDITLQNYKGLKLKKEKSDVVDADVDKALEDLREHAASFAPVEDRPVANDDMVLLDFEGKVDGKTFEGGKATRYPVVVGHGAILKDFEDALVGMTTNQTKEFPVAFPTDYPQALLAGKTAQFTATVRDIKKKVLPALDDAFAKDAFQCETLAELRSKILEDLKMRREAEVRGKVVDQLAEQLIGLHPFDAPPTLIEMEHQRLARQAVDRMKSQGADVAQWPEERQKEFVAQFLKPAERNVRMSMIIEKIGEVENIRCEAPDFDRHLEKLSKALNQPVETVKKYVDQRNQRAEVEDHVMYEKTLDLLIEKASVEAA